MFGVSERSVSDTPTEDGMNSDTLVESAVSFVLSVGIFLHAVAARRLAFLKIICELVKNPLQ